MSKFRYIGECDAGEVVFNREGNKVVMPEGEAVEVPDWLAKKLANNNHFERVGADPAKRESQPADGAGSDDAKSPDPDAEKPAKKPRKPRKPAASK